MYCTNCGKQMEDGARFCIHCGALAEAGTKSGMGVENMGAPNGAGQFMPGQRMEGNLQSERDVSKKTRRLLIVLGIIAVAAIGAIAAVSYLLFSGKSVEEQAAEQLKLGNRYLEETDYEQAVVAFNKTIEIDPSNVDAYLGASAAYVALENYGEAVSVLDAGYGVTEELQIAKQGQAVCLEAAEHYIAEENYEEAEKYIEKGKEYGDSEELDEAAEKLKEISAVEEETYEPPYVWAVEPTIEADNIYYLNSQDYLDTPINMQGKQIENHFGYAVIKRGDDYGLIDMEGNLFDGMNFQSVNARLGDYWVTYKEPHYDMVGGFETTDFRLYQADQFSAAFGYGDASMASGGIYFWNNGLMRHYAIREEDMPQMPEIPEAPIPIRKSPESYVTGGAGDNESLASWSQNLSDKYAVYADGALQTDFIYDECGAYSDGLLAVCQDGKWGYVNQNGEIVIPVEYDASWKEYACWECYSDREGNYGEKTKDYCYAASGGCVVLCQGDKWELRNVQGEEVIRKGEFEEIRPVYDGKCWVKKDGKWGVIQITLDVSAGDSQSDVNSAEVIDSGSCGENLVWKMDSEGTLTISGNGEMDGYTVYTGRNDDMETPPPWLSHRDEIQMVIAEEGVNSIGCWAFFEYENLKNVVLSNTVEYIDRGAFENCIQLEEISLGNGMNMIVKEAFYGCKNLKSIEFPEGFESVGSIAFAGCISLKELRFPESVNKMEASAFADCSGIEQITFEGNVPEIYAASSAYEPRLFEDLTATVCFPADNATYTEEARKEYFGGNLTWKPLEN